MANDEADELADGGARLDGAFFAEQVANGADISMLQQSLRRPFVVKWRIFLDMEEITEDMTQKPEWQFGTEWSSPLWARSYCNV